MDQINRLFPVRRSAQSVHHHKIHTKYNRNSYKLFNKTKNSVNKSLRYTTSFAKVLINSQLVSQRNSNHDLFHALKVKKTIWILKNELKSL